MYKLRQERLNEFLAALCKDREVFALEQAEAASPTEEHTPHYHLVRADAWDPARHTLAPYRPVESLKSLVFRPREYLGEIGGDTASAGIRPRIVIGAKNCDVSALKIHDYVFLDTEPVDPFYAEARENTVIVACDCTGAREVCFCPVVKEQPFAKDGFDINIAPTSREFLVEQGSEKGAALLEAARHLLEEADDALIKERDEKRAAMTACVAEQAAAKGLKAGLDLQGAIRKSEESELWDTFAADCVECGACNFVCCTCHCFLLADGASESDAPARTKQWDSCLYRNFARVAGGANPRGHRAERLHNRFDKKFNFFPDVIGAYACDGCGRCAEACTGKIDIRDVLKKALDEA